MQLPEDDLRIETCWSDFKCFNVTFYVCAFVGVIIKLIYEMRGATIKILDLRFNTLTFSLFNINFTAL